MKELLFTVKRNHQTPMYQQVYLYIKSQIESGKLRENTKLPSVRQLAQLLGVSRNTTQLAYEQLLAEGYIRSELKKGYYVQVAISAYFPQEETTRSLKKEQLISQQPIIDFRPGMIDPKYFPLAKWRALSNKVLKEEIVYQYGEQQGDPLLRESLVDYLFQSRGVRTTSENIVIGSSTQQLLFLLSVLLKKEYAQIAVEDPGYNGAREIFTLQSYGIIPIPVVEDGLDISQLHNSNARLAYVTPSHQFPLGMTMPVHQRYQLIEWAIKSDGYIIEDDYDSEYRYKQRPIPSLHSLTNCKKVIYVSTFSKALLPSVRISYMVLPDQLVVAYKKHAEALEQTASSLHQRTLHYFMKEGHWYPHLRKMRMIYKRKMQILIDAIQAHLQDVVTVIGGTAGLYIVLEVNTGRSEEWLIQEASKNGVKVYPCSPYFVDTKLVKPHIQLGFAGLEESEIQRGIKILAKVWLRTN